jgi:hypothetical protein
MDTAKRQELMSKLQLMRQNYPDRIWNEEKAQLVDAVVNRELADKVCATISVIAEMNKAIEVAKRSTRRATEILTFACASSFTQPPYEDMLIAIEGEALDRGPVVLLEHTDDFAAAQQHAETMMPIVFDRPITSGSRLERLSLLIATPETQLGELDRAILRAVHWWVAAQGQVETENKLLNLITALETIVGRTGGAISEVVSESTALILETAFADRVTVKRFIKGMYDARSGVTHGSSASADRENVRQLRRYAAHLISKMIKRDASIRTRRDLFERLDRMRLEGAPWGNQRTYR